MNALLFGFLLLLSPASAEETVAPHDVLNTADFDERGRRRDGGPRLQAYRDGGDFVVIDLVTGREKRLSVGYGGDSLVLQGPGTLAALYLPPKLHVYDAYADEWFALDVGYSQLRGAVAGDRSVALLIGGELRYYSQTRRGFFSWQGVSGFFGPVSIASQGELVGVLAGDHAYALNAASGELESRAMWGVSGSGRLLMGLSFAAVSHQDQLHVYDSRLGQWSSYFTGTSSLLQFKAAGELAAVYRDSLLTIYDAASGGFRQRRVDASPAAELVVSGGSVVLIDGGRLFRYVPAAGGFQD